MMHHPCLRTLCNLLLILVSSAAFAEFKGEMDQAQAQQAIAAGDIVAIDVRSPEEYNAGHVPGAINVPHNQIDNHLADIMHLRDKAVLLYCRSGRRAGIAESSLTELGFTQLYHLKGDMQGWSEKQLPEEK